MNPPIIPNHIIVHDDETYENKYKWCPACGDNVWILTWNTRLGKRYRCQCGLNGRFGDGVPEPVEIRPKFSEKIYPDDLLVIRICLDDLPE